MPIGRAETLTLLPPPIDRREIFRYAGGHSGADAESDARLEALLREACGSVSCRAVYAVFPVKREDGRLSLGFTEAGSASLLRLFSDCAYVAVFATTVGQSFDRLCLRYAAVSPASALLLDAIGSERAEALTEATEAAIRSRFAAEGYSFTRRVSPGYGDIPLSMQEQIVRVLDTPRALGLTLSDACMLSPLKSVTALMGLRSYT